MATSRATIGGKATEGEWQEVPMRRPYPANWRPSTDTSPTPPTAQPYIPYAKPTYAQVLQQAVKPPTSQPSLPPSQPSSPTSSTTSTFYVSPHSPSRLRFPPSHTFPEWKGCCFRCCRTGHSAAKCRNSKHCGKCWSFGHIRSRCTQEIVAPPQPVPKIRAPALPNQRCEPDFEVLLNGSYPYRAPEMPEERPLSLHCFLERDSEYFAELQRLKQAVVLHTKGF